MTIDKNGDRPSGRRLLILVWSTIFLAGVQFVYGLWSDRQAIEKRSSAQAMAFARLVEKHAESIFDQANLTLIWGAEVLTEKDYSGAKTMTAERRRQIEAHIKLSQSLSPGVVSMSVTDADGFVFANTAGVLPGRSLGDRGYFQKLKEGPRTAPVISEAILGRISNKWGVQIARRLEFSDGRFAGMIVANVGLSENFDRFYQTLDFGKDGAIVLASEGLQFMVRYPSLPELIGKVQAIDGPLAFINKGVPEVQTVYHSPFDGVSRWVAARRVGNYPVYALVGLSQNQILATWYYDVKVTVIVAVLLLLGGGLITREVLARQATEAALREAKRVAESNLNSKTRFLAAASHDLRQPLQAIHLFLRSLGHTPLNVQQKKLFSSLEQAVDSQGRMLNTLLDLSRLDAGIVKPEIVPARLQDVLTQMDDEFSPLFLERGLRFKLYYPYEDVGALTDPHLLQSMLRNLIGNALKYTHKGGVLVSVRPRASRVWIQIWDTGIGISKEHLDQIFEEYFQVGNLERDRTKGLGLGLSIVMRQAALISAEIKVRSRVNRGSVFTIDLPRADLAAFSPTEGGQAVGSGEDKTSLLARFSEQWAGKSVVIIEDDHLVSQGLESALTVLGVKVQVFSNADSALENTDAQIADFYLSDFRLPGPLDGLQLLEQLQLRAGRPIRAALLTGDTSPERLKRCRSSIWPVLFKPVTFDQVVTTIAGNSPGLS